MSDTEISRLFKVVLFAAAVAILIVSGMARAAKFAYPQLSLDSTGPSVRTAKSLLYKQGGYYGPINTTFDEGFRVAVVKFQKNRDITPIDGIIGPKTWNGLKSFPKYSSLF